MRIIQEKMQAVSKPVTSEVNEWVEARTVRVKKGAPGREGRHGGDPTSRQMNNAAHFGSLPPGMDLEDQELTDQRTFRHSTNGNMGDGGDVTQELTPKVLVDGFSIKRMSPTDDDYTNEHADVFYMEVTVDGVTGYLERGNTLDRL